MVKIITEDTIKKNRSKQNRIKKDEFKKLVRYFKQVPGTNLWVNSHGTTVYEVYFEGQFYTTYIERSISMNNYGYMQCGSTDGTKLIHQLVAKAYIGEAPEGKTEIDHKDRDKTNNYYKNLRWVTHQENMQNAVIKDKSKIGKNIYGKYRASTGILAMPDGRKIKMTPDEYIEYRQNLGLPIAKLKTKFNYMTGFRCPNCDGFMKITTSIPYKNGKKKYRKCVDCGETLITYKTDKLETVIPRERNRRK